MDLTTAARRLFAPAARLGRVGAEVELIPVTAGPAPQPVDPAVLVAAFDDTFARDARVSFEPGGQLELSPAPDRLEPFLGRLERLLARARSAVDRCGVRLMPVGTNPYHSCADVPLRTPTPRYRAMQDLFDRVGPDGRRMMRLTASLQVAVDLLPGPAGWEQWVVANLAGPALTAAYANSPWLDGRSAGIAGARTRIWQATDLRRTGYDGRHLDLADPIGAYAAFAAAADRLSIPESADPHYHLSTLFPPVRPRGGYLEIRYLDAQPLDRIGPVVRTVDRLLNHTPTRQAALELLRPRVNDLAADWSAAATGFVPEADELLEIVNGRRSAMAGVA
jgi:glutamate--cysteine ligase